MHGSIKPYNLPLRIPQRGLLYRRFQLSFSGIENDVFAAVWDSHRLVKLLDLEIVWIAREVMIDDILFCDFAVRGEWDDTKVVRKSGMWDLLAVNIADPLDRGFYMRGDAILDPGYTEAP